MKAQSEVVERYASFRHDLLEPIDFDVSPLIMAFLTFVLAVMAAHFFVRGVLFLGGLTVLVHGFTSMLTSEFVYREEVVGGDAYVMMIFERLSEVALLVGLGMTPVVDAGLAIVVIGAISMVYYSRLYALAYFDHPFHARLWDRGVLVLFVGFGGLLGAGFPDALNYALYLLLIVFGFYLLKTLIVVVNKMQESDEKEA